MIAYGLVHGTPNELTGILRIDDQAFIPIDPANTDYKQFVDDVKHGSTIDGGLVDAAAFVATLPVNV